MHAVRRGAEGNCGGPGAGSQRSHCSARISKSLAGVSTLTDTPNFLKPRPERTCPGEPSVASYVRIRREFSVQALFSSVQYSFSNDGQNMVETLVLHVRDPKDLIQVSMEDSASAVTQLRRDACGEYAGQPRSAGAFRKVFGCAGAVYGGRRWSGAGPKRLRTAVPQRVRSAGKLSALLGVKSHIVPGRN